MIELYRSANVVVRSVPAGDAGRWVVTFDHYGLGSGFDRPGFGEAFLRQAGVSAIHVLGRGEDWYQYPDMGEAMAAVRAATAGARRVMTYGSSMGAYAAIRFADAAGANAALAISPQYSIDPARVPFETRWEQDGRRLVFRPEIEARLNCGFQPVIVYDAVGPDRRHADLIAAEIEADLIGLRNIHHPATTFLGEVGLLGPLVFDVLDGTFDAAGFRPKADASRRRSAVCLMLMADRQPAHRPRTARSLAERAHAIAPTHPLVISGLAQHMSRAGEHEAAIALHQTAIEISGREENYLTLQSQILVAAGRLEEAEVFASEAVSLRPDAGYLHYWRGSVLRDLGRREAAIEAFGRALALDPGNPRYQATLDSFASPRGAWWHLRQRLRRIFSRLGRLSAAAIRPRG